MTAPNDVIDKINILPAHVQEQLFNYVEFLYEIYRPMPEDAEHTGSMHSDERELSNEGKLLLEARVQRAMAHPGKSAHWRIVAERIRQKYQWPNP